MGPVSQSVALHLAGKASHGKNKVLWLCHQRPYSQNFIFFVTYKWTQYARKDRLERVARDKHSSLFGTIVSDEEKIKFCDSGNRIRTDSDWGL